MMYSRGVDLRRLRLVRGLLRMRRQERRLRAAWPPPAPAGIGTMTYPGRRGLTTRTVPVDCLRVRCGRWGAADRRAEVLPARPARRRARDFLPHVAEVAVR